MADQTTRKYNDFTLFRRLLCEAKLYWPHVSGIFLLSLLSVPLALLTPVPLKIAVDSVISSQPIPKYLAVLVPEAVTDSYSAVLVLAVGMLVGIALLEQAQKLGSSLLDAYTSEQVVLAFRSQLFRHVQRLSLSYHDSRG